MADGFRELGLRPELVDVVQELGYEAPTALQKGAVPVLRRGGNVVLHASAGAGVVGAYGLALVERLLSGELPEPGEEAGALRALVLVPTPEVATQTAVSLARFARIAELGVAAMGPGWAPATSDAEIVVATPGAALEAVRSSTLKLGGVVTLVLDGLATLFALETQDDVEALTNAISREAQRIVVTAERTSRVGDYVERHVRRPLHIPPVPTEVEEAVPMQTRPLGYTFAGAEQKTDVLARALAGRGTEQVMAVYCRGAVRAQTVADTLALRGFRAGRGTGEDLNVIVLTGDEAAPDGAFVISFDVPFDADTLDTRHVEGGLVLIEHRELPHLKQIAERAGFALHTETVSVEAPAFATVESFRTRLERALMEEDLGAQLLLLEPLFERHAPAEVAAAASALLRRRALVVAEEGRPSAAPSRQTAAAPAPAPPTYVRLFVGVGAREGVRPGDLVGAIAGETGESGAKVGRIEIRDNFSIVEVDSAIADRVIRALNGTTLKGRSVRVDYDRRGSGERRGAGAGAERPRRRLRGTGR